MSDHLDVLEQQVAEMEAAFTTATAALLHVDNLLRKAKARIRAIKREEEARCQTTS